MPKYRDNAEEGRLLKATKRADRKASGAVKQPKLAPVEVLPPLQGKTKNQERFINALLSEEFTLHGGFGCAGTGKTLVALHCAVVLHSRKPGTYKNIIMIKPAVEASGDDLGYLPGGIGQKIGPYQASFYSLLEGYVPDSLLRRMTADQVIKSETFAFLRGATFKNCIIILDEAQNATEAQLHLLCTRVGEDAKIILTGDTHQHDRKGASPIRPWRDRQVAAGLMDETVFTEEDIVRSEFVKSYYRVNGI